MIVRKASISGLLMALACATPGVASPGNDESIVRDFYHLLCDKRQVAEAYRRHVALNYVEHSSDVPGGGRAASILYMERLLALSPKGHVDVLRSASEHGLVFLHARYTPAPGATPTAIVEIFRVSGGSIVEHWDVIQQLPKTVENRESPF